MVDAVEMCLYIRNSMKCFTCPYSLWYRRKWFVINRELALAERLDLQRRKQKQLIVDQQQVLRKRLSLDRMRMEDIRGIKAERHAAKQARAQS